MKAITILVLIIIQMTVISCGDTDKLSEINVGMTYDEVEGVLGKPSAISRGANELYYDIAEIKSDLLQRLNLDTTKAMLYESRRWFVPHQIKTVGNLIYVNWEYDKIKSDTFFVLLNNIREQKDTTIKTYPVYYLGENKVSKSIYDDSDGYLYRIPPGDKIVTKSEYEAYMNKMAESKPAGKGGRKRKLYPLQVEKRIEYKKNVSVKSYKVRESIEKVYYEVEYNYCVIFDASSGRVTVSEYFPFYVRKLHSEIIKEEDNK